MPCSGLRTAHNPTFLIPTKALNLTPWEALQQCGFPGPGPGPRLRSVHLPARQASLGALLQVVTGDALKTALWMLLESLGTC